MALYRHTSGFVCEYASNPGAGYTAISAQPTDTLANRVKWWRDLDKGATGIINSGSITLAGTGATTATLSAGGATDGMYVGMTIAITSGGTVTTVKITAYNGTTKVATFASAMTWLAGSTYAITANWHPSEYRTPQDPAEAVLTMGFSKDAAFFSADSTGAVTDAYLGGSCTVSVTRGTSDVTVSEGWSLTKVDSGCTSTLTQSGGIWTLTITNVPLLATKSGYVRVTATRTGSTTQVRDWNWMKVPAGASGINGTRTAILEMYQWAASAPTTFPAGSSTYTWATGQFTAPATLNGWSLTPPATVVGQTLWVCRTLYADSGTSATSAITWSATAAYASGGAGANGTRTAFLEMYRWSATTPTTFPSGTSTYTWATGAFTAPATPNSWSLTPGAAVAGQTLYGCQVVYSDSLTTTTSSVTWSTSTAYALGAAGTNGTNGVDGTRGSRQLLVTTADGLWVDLTAWNGVVSQTGTTPVLSDLVTIAKTDGTVATSKFCTANGSSPGTWTAPNAYINGSLLVTGTVGANQIAAGSITTSKLAVGAGGNLVQNSGPTPGNATDNWLLGYNDTGLTVTVAAGTTGEYPIGGASVKATVTGTPAAGKIFAIKPADYISVVPGQKYEVSGYLTHTGCSQGYISVWWLNSSFTLLSSSDASAVNAAPSSILGNWPRSTGIVTAPAGAYVMQLQIAGIASGAANPKICATRLFVAEASTNQTDLSPWSPSGIGTLIDGDGIRAGTITADRLVAGTITAASGVIGSLDATTITTGNLNASRISGGTLNCSLITVSNLSASSINAGTLSAGYISGGTLNCSTMTVSNLNATSITAGTITTTKMATNAITYSYAAYQPPGSPVTPSPTSGEATVFSHTVPAIATGGARGAIYFQGSLAVLTTTGPTSYTDVFVITIRYYRDGIQIGESRDVRIKSTTLLSVASSFRDTSCPTTSAVYTISVDCGAGIFWKWGGCVILMELKT